MKRLVLAGVSALALLTAPVSAQPMSEKLDYESCKRIEKEAVNILLKSVQGYMPSETFMLLYPHQYDYLYNQEEYVVSTEANELVDSTVELIGWVYELNRKFGTKDALRTLRAVCSKYTF